MKTGIQLIEEEYKNARKKHSLEYDAELPREILAQVAAEIAAHNTGAEVLLPDLVGDGMESDDPWGLIAKWQNNRIKQLTIAGALIACEIERLQS